MPNISRPKYCLRGRLLSGYASLLGNTLADVLEKLENGKIGHRAAMDGLNVKTYDELEDHAYLGG